MFKVLLNGALAFAFLIFMPVHAQDSRSGTFKSLQGSVSVKANQEVHLAKPGEPLQAGQRVTTGPGDAASVVLRDGTTIVIAPGSSIGLTNYEYDPVTQSGAMLIDVYNGSIRFISGWLGRTHPEAVKVRSPFAMTGIRGTDFIVEAH